MTDLAERRRDGKGSGANEQVRAVHTDCDEGPLIGSGVGVPVVLVAVVAVVASSRGERRNQHHF